MISLIIPPGDQIARVNKMLTDEAGTASNIKSRVNRLSVLGAITSTQQKLKQYAKVPTNGLVIYCGEVLNEAGKVKKLSLGMEPIKPINTSLYMCDNRLKANKRKKKKKKQKKKKKKTKKKKIIIIIIVITCLFFCTDFTLKLLLVCSSLIRLLDSL